jgi:hypothetical protein
MNRLDAELAPSTVGALVDDLPLVSPANIRPYLIAIVLHRGAVAEHELVAALTPHCSMSDLKVGGWSSHEGSYLDNTRLESVIGEILGEFVRDGWLRYNEQHRLWVAPPAAIKFWVTKAIELNACLPIHLLKLHTPNTDP